MIRVNEIMEKRSYMQYRNGSDLKYVHYGLHYVEYVYIDLESEKQSACKVCGRSWMQSKYMIDLYVVWMIFIFSKMYLMHHFEGGYVVLITLKDKFCEEIDY